MLLLPVKGNGRRSASSQTWTAFDALVRIEAKQEQNCSIVNTNLGEQLNDQAMAEAFEYISSEEDVTYCLKSLLEKFASRRLNFSSGFCFRKQSNELISKPDLIAMERDDEALGVGAISDYQTPTKGTKAQVRRENVATVRSFYRFPFETKPVWKFRFLNIAQGHQVIIHEWEIPEDFDAEKMQASVPLLPSHWTLQKKKSFHVLRQLYGHMVSDHRRYGILHVYKRCFFCKRTQEGEFLISRAFDRVETSPSVLQAIKTMVGFSDHTLSGAHVHPISASKATLRPRRPPIYGGSSASVKLSGRGNQTNASTKGNNLAATLCPWDCHIYDTTNNILLMTTLKFPSFLVKLQQDPQKRHVADEIYAALGDNEALQQVIATFHGHSTHLGVAMSCIEREMDDFGDIGLENVSEDLKQSAIHAVSLLSQAGLLHNDLELCNIVQSKGDPDRAKLI